MSGNNTSTGLSPVAASPQPLSTVLCHELINFTVYLTILQIGANFTFHENLVSYEMYYWKVLRG